jgi:hypothetical protein
VICINDSFHPSLVEWTNDVPKKGQVYTVTAVREDAPDAVTRTPGTGLFLAEIPSCGGRLCFSAWRFEPVDDPALKEEFDESAPARLTPALPVTA